MLAMFVLEPTETKAAAFNLNWTVVGHVRRGPAGSKIDDNIFVPGGCDQEKALEIYAVEVQWKTEHVEKLYICSERVGPVRMKIQTDDIDLECNQEKALQIYALEVQWKTGNTEKFHICSERNGPVRMKMETIKIGINRDAQGIDDVKAPAPIVNPQDLAVNIVGLATPQVGPGAGDKQTDDNIFVPGRCDQEKALEIYTVEVQWKTGHIEKLYICSERVGPVRMKIQTDDIFDFGRCDQEKALQIYALEVQWKTGSTEKLYICSERIGPVRMKMQTVKIGINRAAQGIDDVKALVPIVNPQDLAVNIG